MNNLLLACLFAFVLVASAQIAPGTYRQCNLDTGDEILLTVHPGTDRFTDMRFIFGGCLDGEPEYEIHATYNWEFGTLQSDGGYHVEYEYLSAVATAYTSAAVDALQNTCGSFFTIGESQNVLGCLFCPIRYDIYLRLDADEGIFVLGDGIACSAIDRPTQYEESKFVLEPYYGGYSYSESTFSDTLIYNFNNDNDAYDDYEVDEDDEEYYDDDETSIPVPEPSEGTYYYYGTFSYSSYESAASTIVAGLIIIIAAALVAI